jgi:hypothetical protein
LENKIKSKKDFFAEWLEKLQQESWQLELLISGLALYGVFLAGDFIRSLDYYWQVNGNSTYNGIFAFLIILLNISRTIFLINLLTHIIVRGLWIGAIGLRYVSGDIDYDELNYSDRFTKFFKKKIGSFDDYIERLENFSSVLFSFTFLLFFILLSFFVFNSVFILFTVLLTKTILANSEIRDKVFFISGLLYYVLGIFVFIDFITVGGFKRIKDKTVGGIYFWIYRFYSTISLSFLYRPLLLNFLDNRYTKGLFFISIPMLILGILISTLEFKSHEYFPTFDLGDRAFNAASEDIINYRYYDDLREQHIQSSKRIGIIEDRKTVYKVSLSQYEVDKNELKIFLEYERNDTERIKTKNDNIFPYNESGVDFRFRNTTVIDSSYLKLTNSYTNDIKKSMSYGQNPKEDSLLIAKYGDFSGDVKDLQERITESLAEATAKFDRQKSIDIKKAFLNIYDLRLNNVDIKDKLECKYYIHPNMLEKGLLCYLNIDTLAYGGHLISVNKPYWGKDLTHIPFRKIKQNQ